MSSVSEVNVDIKDFLMSINLEQYLLHFHKSGFHTVKACAAIDDSVLLRIGISPTGHRRRILKQLQMILSKMPDIPVYANVHKTKKNDDSSKDCRVPSSAQNVGREISNSHSVHPHGSAQLETVTKGLEQNDITMGKSQSLKSDSKLSLPQHDFPIPDQELHPNLDSSQDSMFGSENIKSASLMAKKVVDCATEQQEAEKAELMSDTIQKLPTMDSECLSPLGSSASDTNSVNGSNGVLESSTPSSFFQFQGEMVINDLYIPSSPSLAPMRSRSKLVSRPSRSFLLRHRPVPEIPGPTKGASGR